MKNILVIILWGFVLFSCNNSSELPLPPEEPCEGIDLWHLPIITHGFYEDQFDSVLVETYTKNADFDKKITEYRLNLGKVNDNDRISRSFNLPKTITTNYDIKIIFSDSLSYQITEMKTEWIPRWCQSFCGYECTLSSFKLNGKLDESQSNIFIKEPSFIYPWDEK